MALLVGSLTTVVAWGFIALPVVACLVMVAQAVRRRGWVPTQVTVGGAAEWHVSAQSRRLRLHGDYITSAGLTHGTTVEFTNEDRAPRRGSVLAARYDPDDPAWFTLVIDDASPVVEGLKGLLVFSPALLVGWFLL